jgi:uncharacterized membrane protein YphA (DoxX/SURF4 family)
MSLDHPRPITAILEHPATWFLARLALTGPYVIGGLVKLSDWPSAVAEQAHFGLQPAGVFAALTIAVELIGAALVLANRLVWLGAGMLGVFTLLAAVVANAFWTLHGPERFMATNAFFEHLGLVGGFVLVAVVAYQRQRGNA